MTRIVYYRFGDNWTRCKYLNAWKARNKDLARTCVFHEALGWTRDPRAKHVGEVFLHDGDPRAINEYQWYKQFGVPELNMKTLLETETEEQAKAREAVVPVFTDTSNRTVVVAPKLQQKPKSKLKKKAK